MMTLDIRCKETDLYALELGRIPKFCNYTMYASCASRESFLQPPFQVTESTPVLLSRGGPMPCLPQCSAVHACK